MNGVNKVILVGNLGLDPEFKRLDKNVSKVRLRIATTETYKNSLGDKVDRTEWHSIVLWRGLADLAHKYLRKGARVYIEGKLRNRQIENHDGTKKTITEIEAETLVMLDRRQDSFPKENSNFGDDYPVNNDSVISGPNFEDLGNDEGDDITHNPF